MNNFGGMGMGFGGFGFNAQMPQGGGGGIPPPGAASWGMGGGGGPMRAPHGGGGPRGMLPYGRGKGGGHGRGGGSTSAASGHIDSRTGAPTAGAGAWGIQGVGRGRFQRAKNDYAQHFVDTGLRPANFIRDSDVQERFEEYPKLKELIDAKDALIAERATPPTTKKVDLRNFDLTTLGTKFDVIMIDPPWEEYRARRIACGGIEGTDSMEVWTPQEIQDLRIDLICDTPSFCFLWAGAGVSLAWGRQCLRKWGFRRCEDICWVKSNRGTADGQPGKGRNFHWLPDSVVTTTTEHCLVGIKGTVRRNTDGDKIHANVDTDVMLSEEPPYGAADKPQEIYAIVEHFCNGRRRLELFGEDSNVRRGWLTLGKDLSESNHDADAWRSHFEGTAESYLFLDDVPQVLPNHLLGTTPLIESIRPKSPTQLREEAQKRQQREFERATQRQHAEIEAERQAAAEMGLEIERAPPPPIIMPALPTSFKEQSPFMAPGTNAR